MSTTTYSIEHAKSGRSKCKKCKVAIAKGDVRLCVFVPKKAEGGFDMSMYYHVSCFNLPRKLKSEGMTAQEFVDEHLEDEAGDILPDQAETIAEQIEQTAPKAAASPAKAKSDPDGGDGGEEVSLISKLKVTLKKRLKKGDDGDERPAKKAKKEEDAAGPKEEDFELLLGIYEQHHKSKLDELKNILRWNRQMVSGNKDELLLRIIDGEMHGRLGYCCLCGGQLKLSSGSDTDVECRGRFDESAAIRVPCSYRNDRRDPKTPRLVWFHEEPTEDQKDEMDREAEEAQGQNDGGAKDDVATNPVKAKLLEDVKKFDWDLTSKAGIKSATTELIDLVTGKVDLPDGVNAKMALGSIIVAHKNDDDAQTSILQAVLDKYGFAHVKAEQAAARESVAGAACANPANAPLLLAMQELAGYYLKEGNRNAFSAYNKVTKALQNLEMEVTADNAMSMSKGPTKVAGVGKSSAEKFKEFCMTGTIAKLEEKRANNA